MPTLKIFRGNWDGRNERAVVSPTMKQAAELLGAGRTTMRDFFVPQMNIRAEDEIVWATPGVVFHRAIRYGPEKECWRRVVPESPLSSTAS